MQIEPFSNQVSIVLLGNFNVAIYQPAWFALHKMLGQKEAEAAKVELIHPEISRFEVDQISIEVTPNRFVLTNLDSHPEHIRDLVINCFAERMSDTPVTAMGINRTVHFDTGDFEVRERVGNILAPKNGWGTWGAEIAEGPSDPTNHRGGVISITMRQSQRPDERKGHIQAKVEPSTVIESNTGIFVEINDHFNLRTDEGKAQTASSAVAVLEAEWEATLQRSDMIVDQIMALTEECRS